MSFVSWCFEPEIFDTLFEKCNDPACCCGCCSALRPRYKRLVDSIYPENPEEGLVRSNMDKLCYYAMSSDPHKQNQIGEYLAYRTSRDVSRGRVEYVIISMEAFDQLLVVCHAQTLTVFVESFLKIVQKLLESDNVEFQILATNSFIKFANIEEDAPSYHRRYDFFISKFSSMCHSNHSDPETRRKLRVAGVRGLQGVIRKSVSDGLVVNIWEPEHMEKIVPSLLFNMQEGRTAPMAVDIADSPLEEVDPAILSETCLRELVAKAAFGNVKAILDPVLKHLDDHEHWTGTFAVHTFKVITYSIPSQYSHKVVDTLMTHLDQHAKERSAIRTGILEVIAVVVTIAAGETVGPLVLETIDNLLRHLRLSLERKLTNDKLQQEERIFQDTIIHTLGEFVQKLPDYSKGEIMQFILNKVVSAGNVPDEKKNDPEVILLQATLLKCLLQVAMKYKRTNTLAQTFPPQFILPLLGLMIHNNPDVRLAAHFVVQALLDRHGNIGKLSKPSLVNVESEMNIEKVSRADQTWMKRNGPEIYYHIHDGLHLGNNREVDYNAIYCTMALAIVELGSEDTLIDIIKVLLTLQDMALNNTTLSPEQRLQLHTLIGALFNLIGQMIQIPTVGPYIDQVIRNRLENAPYILPDSMLIVPKNVNLSKLHPNILFTRVGFLEAFKDADVDSTRIQTDYVPKHGSLLDVDKNNVKRSTSDLRSISLEVESLSSLHGITKHDGGGELVTVDSLRKMMAEPLGGPLDQVREKEQAEKRAQLREEFRTATFAELIARTETKKNHHRLDSTLQNTFELIDEKYDRDLEERQARDGQESVRDKVPIKPKLTSGKSLDTQGTTLSLFLRTASPDPWERL